MALLTFSVAEFHPDIEKLQLFTAAEDYKIRIWDLRTSTTVAILDSHFSMITSIKFSVSGHTLYSAGRDSVVTVWDLGTNKKEMTIPVFEVRKTKRYFGSNSKQTLELLPLQQQTFSHVRARRNFINSELTFHL